MPSCVAYGCTNRTANKRKDQQALEDSGIKITFRRFPKNVERNQKWIRAVHRKNWQPSATSVICSRHFTESDFDRTSLAVVRLRENAIPSIFEGFPLYLQAKKSKPRSNRSPKQQEQNLQLSPIATTSTTCSLNTAETNDTSTNWPDMTSLDISPIRKTTTRSTSISPTTKRSRLESPTKQLLRKSFKYRQEQYRRKIKTLQRCKTRQKKKITDLKKVLTDLKSRNLLSEDTYEAINSIPIFQQKILLRQLKKQKKGSIPRQYEPELRSFALTLHYYSPAAYRYVRRQFNSSLPHPKTLYRWYTSIKGKPGFTKEAIDAIRARAQQTNKQLYCSLVFDEMAIYKSAVYTGKEYFGHVDMGTRIDTSCNELATQVLVFLLVAINDNWKIPVAYFLCNGVKAEEKKTLINHCINLTSEAGVKIINITFDGTSSNLATARCLGCQLDPNQKLKPYFRHPDNKSNIYIFLDPCHMLKLIRNTLGELKHIEWEQETVQWKYIESLHNLQEYEGLHLGNKLKSAHVKFGKQKMKVRLAAQVFSESVADAIELCNKNLHLPDFQHSEKTVEFIRMINKLFDIFNSKSFRQMGFKKPLSPIF